MGHGVVWRGVVWRGVEGWGGVCQKCFDQDANTGMSCTVENAKRAGPEP